MAMTVRRRRALVLGVSLASTCLACSGAESGAGPDGGVSASGGTSAAGAFGTGAGGSASSTGARSSAGGASSVGNGGNAALAGGASSVTGGASGSAGAPGGGGAASSGGTAGGGGAPGAGGNTSAGGSGSSAGGAGAGGGGSIAACKFASGLNVAWVNFARDVPNPDLGTFSTIFQNTHAAGGRVVRWWFHTNGTTTPGYDSSGKAQNLQQSHVDGVKAILGAAHDAGVVVNISLWSFDMLQSNAGDAHTNNQLLLENDSNRQAYIDNYLTPLVSALKGTPGLYSYEIFNEPEGMGANGWATYRTTEAFIQKTVNWFAAAIHDADPSVLVTNGAVTFDYCSGVGGKTNYYSDSALRSAGGKQNGTLDYYQVHYYTSNGASNSCFTRPASYWNLDKKLVMGEFAAQATDGVALADLHSYLYDNGYDGGWAWAYTADFPWPAMQAPLQKVYAAHPDVGSCP